MGAGHDNGVLVVDDEEDVRESLREVVEMAGCTALLAANGADALALLGKCRPCLIIVDLIMPVMSGLDFLKALREQPHLADVPVVISTSAPERAPAAIPVLKKPVSLRALWEWIDRACKCATSHRASPRDGDFGG